MNVPSVPLVSVIIPSRNEGAGLLRTIEAVLGSSYRNYEIILVDDASDDDSLNRIRHTPAKIISFKTKRGASAARNEGARTAKGEIFFFIDADCHLLPDTVEKTAASVLEHPEAITGGTYSAEPVDSERFFSRFQAVFIRYFELKNPDKPDYIATHAMAMKRKTFLLSGGFEENFMPIIEDVEFSHRMKKRAVALRMDPGIEVRHFFGFNFFSSVYNAFRKSLFWTAYSLSRGDILRDSGTASLALKINTCACCLMLALSFAAWKIQKPGFLYIALFMQSLNLFVNYGLFREFKRHNKWSFSLKAALYYLSVYPLAVGAGGFFGLLYYFVKSLKKH